ncbi:nucleoside triphosphate pyrophosphohydrolase [Aliterella atlantica]|uniref:Nucleoside triphosphate hydrolase n=1 Tax=Aliterella atlantica CENA595 TaxID=1618023 RepID=A0A0D8ZKU3_9CYAN|nr:nucleoside triphosphate hydrolase [Aliterella atlantica CENA595]
MSKQTNHNPDAATLSALQQIIDVVARLRAPDGGCPWDLAQTQQTLTPYVIEEAYEVVEAIHSGEQKAIAEELGDLLLQVVLQAQIATEENKFSLKEVAQGISEKLIRRHPHVFGNVEASSVEQVKQNWEEIKAIEKGEENTQLSSKLSRYTHTFPPLMAGMKISQKAAKAGFEWENVEGVWAKFQEELAEFKQAIALESRVQQQAELGDLLFTIINLARWYKLDPSEALIGTNKRFIQRLSHVETLAGRPLADYTLEELENMWQQAKAKIASEPE